MKSLIKLPKKMNALVLHDVAKLSLDIVDVPKLLPETVLVKIKACGICSSDIPRIFVNGTYHFPTVPGHEFSGRIVAIGDGVEESLLGRKTCVFPLLPCRKCRACELGEYAQCENYSYFGSRCDGGFAEYLVVPVWNLVPFDDCIPYDVAALCEPAAVSLHALNLAGVKEGMNVAVVGTGTIGFLIAAFARGRKANVAVCGRSGKKKAYAEELGFQTLDTVSPSLPEDAGKLINQDGFDVVIEAVGENASIETSVRLAGALGTVVLVGNPSADLALPKDVYWSVLRKQITLKGSWNSSYRAGADDWADAVEALKGASFDFARLVTHTFPLKAYEKAFDVIRDKDEFSLKVMFIQDSLQERKDNAAS